MKIFRVQTISLLQNLYYVDFLDHEPLSNISAEERPFYLFTFDLEAERVE